MSVNYEIGLMGIQFNIVSTIVAITVMHGFILALAIAFKRSTARRANLILSLFIIIYSFTLTNIVIGFSNLLFYITPLIFTDVPFFALIGPLFYFYVMEVTDASYKKKWYYFSHFVPFIIAIALMLPFYLNSSEDKIIIFANQRNIIPYNIKIILLGHQIQMFIYLFIFFHKTNN